MKYGFRPVDVQRSAAAHLPPSCATLIRRIPAPPAPARALTITSPSAVIAGCTMAPPSQACCQSTLPVFGSTLVVPGPLMKSTCCTPPIVTRCGEL